MVNQELLFSAGRSATAYQRGREQARKDAAEEPEVLVELATAPGLDALGQDYARGYRQVAEAWMEFNR